MRTVTPFNEHWLFYKPGEEKAPVDLPHTWNASDGQDGGNDYWRGTAYYEKQFKKPALQSGERVFLEINGAAMSASVRLNGQLLTEHAGGYSTFRADLTDALQDDNLLEISVDNSENDRVYPQMADFTFYGGLYRSVNLITVPSAHFELVKDGTPGIRVTPIVDLEKKCAEVTVTAWATGGDRVVFTLPAEDGEKVLTSELHDGSAEVVFTLENVHLWDGLCDPYLYCVKAELCSGDAVTDCISPRFGCRVFEIDPEKGFFLNGRAYPLRGVSRHQDRLGLGNAITVKEHREDIEIALEIGANTLRLAHYQHAQEFYDLCDERGLIVWAEIPYITRHMPNGRENTISQMKELITQCHHHPSIFCWGLSNEITASGGVTDDLLENHRILNELCHEMDPTRPTTMAHAFMLEQESPLIGIADLGAYNLYFGWYLGELEQNDSFLDEYHEKFPKRPLGFSEYGADANPAFHSSAPERSDYTEEYQCVYHEHLLQCIEERPYLFATHVWNLFDFAADGRDEGGKNGQNQKGLVTFDRKTRKDAFYLYKAAWSQEPFVHLCGSRYADRAEEVTEVKVYSNLACVSLYVDGKLLETQEGRRIFRFRVPITGEHELHAVGEGSLSGAAATAEDTMRIRRVPEPNPAYFFGKKKVVNWFDKEDLKEGFFSIHDTFGELMSNPAAAAVVGPIMQKARDSRGDVAKSTADNPNLQKMMASMRFDSMLKAAGDAIPEEAVRAMNAALQRIPK